MFNNLLSPNLPSALPAVEAASMIFPVLPAVCAASTAMLAPFAMALTPVVAAFTIVVTGFAFSGEIRPGNASPRGNSHFRRSIILKSEPFFLLFSDFNRSIIVSVLFAIFFNNKRSSIRLSCFCRYDAVAPSTALLFSRPCFTSNKDLKNLESLNPLSCVEGF